MVKIRHMRVGVLEALVPVGMRMRLGLFIAFVLVLVMLVVDVPVVVIQRLVNVRVGVFDPDQEPRAGDHEGRACGAPQAWDFSENRPR